MLTCGKDALAASFDLAHIKGLFWKSSRNEQAGKKKEKKK